MKVIDSHEPTHWTQGDLVLVVELEDRLDLNYLTIDHSQALHILAVLRQATKDQRDCKFALHVRDTSSNV